MAPTHSIHSGIGVWLRLAALMALIAGALLATFAFTSVERAGAQALECKWGYWIVPGRTFEPDTRGIPCDEPRPGWTFSDRNDGTVIYVYDGDRVLTPSSAGIGEPVIERLLEVQVSHHRRAPVSTHVGPALYQPDDNNRVVIGDDGNCYRERREGNQWLRSESYGSGDAACRRASWNAHLRAQGRVLHNPRNLTSFPTSDPPAPALVDRHSGGRSSGGTLVGNARQASGFYESAFGGDTAQPFNTGPNPGGYTLTSVELSIRQTAATPPGFNVSIRVDWFGEPGATLGTLTNPSSLPRQTNQPYSRFTTSGIHLNPNTKYWVLIDVTSGPDNAGMVVSDSHHEDYGGEAGFSIGNNNYGRAYFRSGSFFAADPPTPIALVIKGSPVGANRTLTTRPVAYPNGLPYSDYNNPIIVGPRNGSASYYPTPDCEGVEDGDGDGYWECT
ncbi:MAG: hypothetical protein OXH13_08535 [Chloroflexi bacterium]|nr:hypothetical protein [Chloroflexota bacterium]MCY3697516.1 hypothetical protein [Chloroflexota bacterium]